MSSSKDKQDHKKKREHTFMRPMGYVDPIDFHKSTKLLRKFFEDELGFVESHPQTRANIISACENVDSITPYLHAGQSYPNRQTNQLDLEVDMLQNPNVNGYYCITTSYRNEIDINNPRYDLIFPMCEFELHGGYEKLMEMESKLLEFVGYVPKPCEKLVSPMSRLTDEQIPLCKYEDVARYYNVQELEHEHEDMICQKFGNAVMITDFPCEESYWNMKTYKKNGKKYAKKTDVILSGWETIGSAEREVDKDVMRENFYLQEQGRFVDTLYRMFGKDRVEKELNEFLSQDFFPRSGGGIGLTRFIRFLKLNNLL
tara:strand:+ start:705 stop:1646 length:942 start_codon:yes stop_codon:yes gene_type:complete